jgi:hypothetical protein
MVPCQERPEARIGHGLEVSGMLNACELEIDLFCRGLRVPDDVSLDGARGVSRTRAGLGSGLEIVLPTGAPNKKEIWANVPVVEPFAAQSPYRLDGSPEGGYRIIDDRSGLTYRARLPQQPAWYSRQTARGVPMTRIGVLQGTYLGIYINHVCAFWNYAPALNCRFCTTGQNVGTNEIADKTIADVVETCRAAREESNVTFVHLNGGFLGSKGLEFALPYVRAIKEQVGMLVGVQLAPEKEFTRYDTLIDAGVDHFSFCVELLDPEWFARICPGKARVHGQALFFEAMEYCAARMPRGAVSGEIIAGIEPIDRTLEAIDRITSLGAFPTVCIFRPTVGSDMEDWPPPVYEDMRRVMQHMYDACRRHWMPIGAAPNIEVSLVVNPDDAALLAEPGVSVFAYEAWRRLIRIAAKRTFRRRMRPRAAGQPLEARRSPHGPAGGVQTTIRGDRGH